jgi:hypothetical protein
MLVHGSVSRTLAPMFMERLQRVAQDFAQLGIRSLCASAALKEHDWHDVGLCSTA